MVDLVQAAPALAAIHVKVPLPPKVATAVAIAGGILFVLALVVLLVANRKRLAPSLLRWAPFLLGAFGLYAVAALYYATTLQARQQAIAERFQALVKTASEASAALGDAPLPESLEKACAGRLPGGPAGSLAGYLGAAPEGSIPSDLKAHGELPRMMLPFEDPGWGLNIDSEPLSGRPPLGLATNWRHLLLSFPDHWRFLKEFPRNDLTAVKHLVVARIRDLQAPSGASYSQVKGGRLTLAVRVLPAVGGPALCEGTASYSIPPVGAALSPSLDAAFWLGQGLENAPFAALCRAGGDKLCEQTRRYAGAVPDAPPVEAEATAPASPSASPEPAAPAGPPDRGASCDKDAIAQGVRIHLLEVRKCYERSLRKNGKVNLQFTIGAKGRVTDARVSESTLHDDKTEACLVGKLKRWKFAPPRGGTCNVNYPFVFQSAK